MKNLKRILSATLLVAMGYILGSYQWETTPSANAEQYKRPASADILKVREAYSILTDVRGNLINDNRHQNALTIVNPLAVCSGGINVIDDLNKGNGVDPVTFGALYAGLASPDLANELGFDEQGRLLFRNKEVRLYSPKKMAKLYERFVNITSR